MSAWLFDLGNTRLKCAPLRADGRPGEAVALPHREEDVAAALAELLPQRIDVAYLASVAHPALRVRLDSGEDRHFHSGEVSVRRAQDEGNA